MMNVTTKPQPSAGPTYSQWLFSHWGLIGSVSGSGHQAGVIMGGQWRQQSQGQVNRRTSRTQHSSTSSLFLN